MKAAMRRAALAARAACDPAWGMRLAGHVLAQCPPLPGQVVAGFLPLAGEIDIRPLLLALAGRGHPIVLPATPPRGQPLTFHRWQPGAPLLRERFGTLRAAGEALRPDVLLVPLLAFDAAGRRLGYGGGYYDRTLAGLQRRRTIGCAFAAQQVDAVPTGPHDVALDLVATERGLVPLHRDGLGHVSNQRAPRRGRVAPDGEVHRAERQQDRHPEQPGDREDPAEGRCPAGVHEGEGDQGDHGRRRAPGEPGDTRQGPENLDAEQADQGEPRHDELDHGRATT